VKPSFFLDFLPNVGAMAGARHLGKRFFRLFQQHFFALPARLSVSRRMRSALVSVACGGVADG